jgi:hypothetical protein
LVRPALLRSRQRIAAVISMAAVYGGMLATFFLTVQLLSHQFGYSPLRSGVAFLPVPLGVFTMSRLRPGTTSRLRCGDGVGRARPGSRGHPDCPTRLRDRVIAGRRFIVGSRWR